MSNLNNSERYIGLEIYKYWAIRNMANQQSEPYR